MKPVGILGGSFDPIHLGHLITSYDVLEKRNLEKIIFVPCHISPHKTDQRPTEDIHRLNMVNLAIEQYPYFESSDYEIRKGDISYTYNTLVELKKSYDQIELIIGFDNLIVFDEWYRPNDILKLAKVVVMKREIDNIPVKHNKYFDSVILLETTLIDISSTEIRERVKNGASIDYLVPSKVKEYISAHSLYK
ncbi:MAG: nicotinate (nicotinamide) nucleotide adenylyltransferase [Ignavibacteriales bacterium]|nr:nicotinate (nicotinamide) nucleotide adenylyltransferase [Ignavibacteriales bacterium]